jgi:hypothetical protein
MYQFYMAANTVELQPEIQNCMQLTLELLCDYMYRNTFMYIFMYRNDIYLNKVSIESL